MDNLLFDFNVDKAARTVYITRAFDAELSLVWDSFTKQEILDQWWAPKPLISKTKYMDFSVGGRRFYAMVSPDGKEVGWQLFDYTSITPKSNFKCISVFTDKDEVPLFSAVNWDLNFSKQNDSAGNRFATVSISIYFESLQELEKMIELGFREGFTSTLTELNKALKTLRTKI